MVEGGGTRAGGGSKSAPRECALEPGAAPSVVRAAVKRQVAVLGASKTSQSVFTPRRIYPVAKTDAAARSILAAEAAAMAAEAAVAAVNRKQEQLLQL